MREIKFRVWDNNYKYMNYKVLVGMWGDDVMDDKNYTACSMYVNPENVDYKCKLHWCNFEPYHKDIKLMQYTGIKDKNGIEIYEGDIVKIIPMDIFNDNRFIGEVKFYDGSFVIDNGKESKFLFREIDELKILGNIYENPELLQIK